MEGRTDFDQSRHGCLCVGLDRHITGCHIHCANAVLLVSMVCILCVQADQLRHLTKYFAAMMELQAAPSAGQRQAVA